MDYRSKGKRKRGKEEKGVKQVKDENNHDVERGKTKRALNALKG